MTLKTKFRKRFGKSVTKAQINAVWDSWVESQIQSLLRGGEVRLDNYNSIEIVGSPIWKDKTFSSALIEKRGFIKLEHLNPRRKDIKYRIEFKNKLAKKPLYFRATNDLKWRVHKALCETNTYYSVK